MEPWWKYPQQAVENVLIGAGHPRWPEQHPVEMDLRIKVGGIAPKLGEVRTILFLYHKGTGAKDLP